jgi:hypothetical protein
MLFNFNESQIDELLTKVAKYHIFTGQYLARLQRHRASYRKATGDRAKKNQWEQVEEAARWLQTEVMRAESREKGES